MNRATIERRKAPGTRLGVFLLGLAVAAAGTFAFAGGQAGAAEKTITFDKGLVNLGFAFKNAPIMPAAQTIPGTVSNPTFNPATAFIANPNAGQPGQPDLIPNPANPTTTLSETGTRLFDRNALDPATFTGPTIPGSPAYLPDSFTPLGCGTPVTFGLYAAMAVEPDGSSGSGLGDLILNPIGQSASQPGFVINGLPNAGGEYYRVLNRGAVVASTLANGAQAAGATLTVDSTSGFADTGTINVDGDTATYTGKTATTFTGVSGLDGPVADNAEVGRVASFVNPFTGSPQTITGPYPAEPTLWEPYAIKVSTFDATNPGTPKAPAPLPVGQNPTNLGSGQLVPGTGTPDLNPVQENTVPGGFCANPTDGKAVVDLNEATGEFTGTSDGFDMPIMIVPNPLDGSPVPITLKAPDGITGTISSAGDVRINGRMQVQVLVGLASNPLGQYCALDLPGREPGGFGSGTPTANGAFNLTSSYMLPTSVGYSGTPYTTGLEGNGALAGTWNVTADSVSVGGANCATVNSVSKGLGGIWLSSNIATPAPITGSCSTFDRVGTFPSCLTRAAFGKVTVKGPGKAKRNKRVTYTVRVPNTGEADATGVRVAVKGKGVKASASGGTIAGKASKSVKVRVTAKKTGKVRMTFTVTGKGIAKKTATKTVTVGR